MSIPLSLGALLALVSALPGASAQLADVEILGSGTEGGAGVPELQLAAPFVPGQPVPALRLVGGAPSATAQLVLGLPDTSPTPLPGFGAELWPAAPRLRLLARLDEQGESPPWISQPAELPAALQGLSLVVQGLVVDAAAQGGLAFTAGLELTVGQGSVAGVLFDGAQFLVAAPSTSAVLAVGDLDGRFGPDVVTVDEDAHVSVGLSAFGELLVPGAPAAPALVDARGALLADLDGDGTRDLVLSGVGGADSRPGLGDGRFGPAQLDAPGQSLGACVLGDVDGDGDLDLLAPRTASGAFVLLRGLPGVHWAAPESVDTGLVSSRSLASGDVDADGDLDVVVLDAVASLGLGRLALLRNAGDGTFGAPIPLSASSQQVNTSAVALGDLDADGAADLLVGSQGGGFFYVPPKVEVRRSLGDGTFGEPFDVDAGAPVRTLSVQDLDADDVADVFVDAAVDARWLPGAGDGSLGASQATGSGLAVARVVAAIVGDALSDEVALGAGGVLRVRASLADPPVVPSVDFGGSARELADLDGDGRLDVVAVDDGHPTLALSFGLGDGGFLPPVLLAASDMAYWVSVGDVTSDGVPDLVSIEGAILLDVLLYVGAGDGTFAPPVSIVDDALPAYLRLVDLDGDGDLDVIGSTVFASECATWLGDGSGGFATGPVTDLDVGSGGQSYAAALFDPGDLDGDGLPDLVVAHADAALIDVRRGLGDGSFGAAEPRATPFVPRLVDLADLDLDGRLDLVVCGPCPPGTFELGELPSNRVLVFRGLGDGSFETSAACDVTTPVCASWLEVTDVDLDGWRDVVLSTENGVSVLLGLGGGRLAPAQPFSGPPGVVLPGDLDGDGDVELIVSSSQGSIVLENAARP
ncbi:MAG: VCBS repeat-containing protein [Planctomycetes bacterium]|nr:VCBS repeat-containing protein [Planctomycetota bacterium]